jgi:hypothetical protein
MVVVISHSRLPYDSVAGLRGLELANANRLARHRAVCRWQRDTSAWLSLVIARNFLDKADDAPP